MFNCSYAPPSRILWHTQTASLPSDSLIKSINNTQHSEMNGSLLRKALEISNLKKNFQDDS